MNLMLFREMKTLLCGDKQNSVLVHLYGTHTLPYRNAPKKYRRGMLCLATLSLNVSCQLVLRLVLSSLEAVCVETLLCTTPCSLQDRFQN